jgi:hypothetical protein
VKRGRALPLFGAAAALVAAALWLDRGRPGTDEAQRERAALLPGFDATRAARVELRRGADGVTLVKEGGAWWVAAPHVRAETGRVESLLGALEGAAVERRVAADARTLGLEAPRVTLIVDGHRLRLGADDAAGRGVYLARDDEREALLVDRHLLETSDVASDAWRARRLCVDGVSGAVRLAWGPWALVRDAGGVWRLERPFAARATAAAVESLLGALDRASARRDAPAPLSGGVPLVVDGREVAVIGGSGGGGCGDGERGVLRADGAALCFAAADLAQLEAPPATWREARLVPFAIDGVRAIEVRAGTRALKLERTGGAWRLVAPLDAAGPADDAAVREWLTELTALRADHFGAPATPIGRMRIATAADAVEATLADAGGGALDALRPGEPEALHLAGARAAVLDAAPLRFRPRRIAAFSPDAVARLTVEERGAAVELDEVGRARLLEAFSGLRAQRFLAPAPDFHPLRRISVTLRDGTSYAVELDSACRGRAADAPIFLLDEPSCGALTGSAAAASAPPRAPPDHRHSAAPTAPP